MEDGADGLLFGMPTFTTDAGGDDGALGGCTSSSVPFWPVARLPFPDFWLLSEVSSNEKSFKLLDIVTSAPPETATGSKFCLVVFCSPILAGDVVDSDAEVSCLGGERGDRKGEDGSLSFVPFLLELLGERGGDFVPKDGVGDDGFSECILPLCSGDPGASPVETFSKPKLFFVGDRPAMAFNTDSPSA